MSQYGRIWAVVTLSVLFYGCIIAQEIQCPDDNVFIYCAALGQGYKIGWPYPNVKWESTANTLVLVFNQTVTGAGIYVDMQSMVDKLGTFCVDIRYTLEGSDTLGVDIFNKLWRMIPTKTKYRKLTVSDEDQEVTLPMKKDKDKLWSLVIRQTSPGPETWKLTIKNYKVKEGACRQD